MTAVIQKQTGEIKSKHPRVSPRGFKKSFEEKEGVFDYGKCDHTMKVIERFSVELGSLKKTIQIDKNVPSYRIELN